MRFLTPIECAEWCSRRGYPLQRFDDRIIGQLPDLRSAPLQFVDFNLPPDSGAKVALARFLFSQLDPAPEVLLWLANWAVWPSCQHMPLFTRFRQAFGERRPLIEAPGHLLEAEEEDDALSILVVALEFFWDCYAISASGRDVVYISHDEIGWFGSRDPLSAESVRDEVQRRWSGKAGTS